MDGKFEGKWERSCKRWNKRKEALEKREDESEESKNVIK
jgi:hypothetical protein